MQLRNETNAQILLRANYYNGRLDCWEPCLENLQIEVRGRSQANGSSDMVVDVKDSIRWQMKLFPFQDGRVSCQHRIVNVSRRKMANFPMHPILSLEHDYLVVIDRIRIIPFLLDFIKHPE